MIQAKVIADSKNEFGNRITTMIVTMPRIILAEFNTHRMLSRNSASSRAIPFEKMVKAVEENPFIPIAWQKDHKGMQGVEYITDGVCLYEKTMLWLGARNEAVKHAKMLNTSRPDSNVEGVTKQLCNRLLEPFMWHTVIVTATEWENFFALRCPQYAMTSEHIYRSKRDAMRSVVGLHSDTINDTLYWLSKNKGQAEIHMMAVAEAIWDALHESIPKELKAGEWHIPFGDNIDRTELAETFGYRPEYGYEQEIQEDMIKIATARCARVSYTVVGEEGKVPNYENDIQLHDRLAASGHWSPFEHCAMAMDDSDDFGNGKWSGNFKGFIQYRKTFQNENITNE